MCATRLFRISRRTSGQTASTRTDVDPALGQQILDVVQRQRVSDVHDRDQTNDFR
jgi:hypothetical protein